MENETITIQKNVFNLILQSSSYNSVNDAVTALETLQAANAETKRETDEFNSRHYVMISVNGGDPVRMHMVKKEYVQEVDTNSVDEYQFRELSNQLGKPLTVVPQLKTTDMFETEVFWGGKSIGKHDMMVGEIPVVYGRKRITPFPYIQFYSFDRTKSENDKIYEPWMYIHKLEESEVSRKRMQAAGF